jgi:hypothetical protein
MRCNGQVLASTSGSFRVAVFRLSTYFFLLKSSLSQRAEILEICLYSSPLSSKTMSPELGFFGSDRNTHTEFLQYYQ